MGKVIVGATLSLDGFMNDRSGLAVSILNISHLSDIHASIDCRPTV